MKKLLLLSLFIFDISFSLMAQPSIQWQKCLGGSNLDYANAIRQTPDSGYIVAGSSMSNDSDVTGNYSNSIDFWIVKLNSSGIIQWQKSLGGTNGEYTSSIQLTADSGYIIAGASLSNDSDVTANHGGLDYWVVKLNSLGIIQWQKSLGGSNEDWANSVQQTSDGGYIVAGRSNSNDSDVTGNHGGYDFWVVKLDSIGSIEWQKSLGGSFDDYANSIQQTSDSGYIVAGLTLSNDSDVTGNHGNYDCWVVKLNSAGIIQWQKCLGGSVFDFANSIQQTTDSGYIVAGHAESNDSDVTGNHGAADYWIVKLNSTGTIQWQKCLGGSSSETPHSIQQTTDGGYIVAGITHSIDSDVTGNHGGDDYWVVKLNSTGTLQWQKCLGGSSYDETAYAVQQTMDEGFIIAGFSGSYDGDVTGNNGGPYDYWIVKLSPVITGIEEIRNPLSSLQISPNPVSHSAGISFSLFQSENIVVTIYDLTGREIKTLFDGTLAKGHHKLKWNPGELPTAFTGIYILNIMSAGYSKSCRFVVID